MRWKKHGLIYSPSGKNGYDLSHCHKPTPLIIDDSILRIYFGVRDKNNKSRTTFIDVDINNLSKIKYIHDKPVLDLGNIGTFDDCGANVCSVIRKKDEVYMYFIGWNTSTTVPSRNALGLAISKDNGLTFKLLYDGPILERFKEEPYHIGAVDVMFDDGKWKMWYNSGIGFKIINGKPEYRLHIKYATSKNGIDWERNNIICIAPKTPFEVIGRPSVIKLGGIYKMWYSKRDIINFRTDIKHSYRAGYAESKDGINWERLDEKVGINISNIKGDWDSEMIAYPYVIEISGKLVMFYNGNGFGKTGFGYAIYE